MSKKIRKYWLVWLHQDHYGTFQRVYPAWILGEEDCKKKYGAAVKATSMDEAKALLCAAYDNKPAPSVHSWKCCFEKSDDWSPFDWDWLKRADWMEWTSNEDEMPRRQIRLSKFHSLVFDDKPVSVRAVEKRMHFYV